MHWQAVKQKIGQEKIPQEKPLICALIAVVHSFGATENLRRKILVALEKISVIYWNYFIDKFKLNLREG